MRAVVVGGHADPVAQRGVRFSGRLPIVLHEALRRLPVDLFGEFRGRELPVHLLRCFFHDGPGVDAGTNRFQDRLVASAIEVVELALPGSERAVDRPHPGDVAHVIADVRRVIHQQKGGHHSGPAG